MLFEFDILMDGQVNIVSFYRNIGIGTKIQSAVFAPIVANVLLLSEFVGCFASDARYLVSTFGPYSESRIPLCVQSHQVQRFQ